MKLRILRMYGAKWRLAPWIVKHFPPRHVYVEAFGGSAAVLLSKEPSPVEVYNDLDGEVVNFFRVLREQPEDLARAIAFTPYARSELDTAWEPTDDPLEAARRFAVRSWMAIGGPTTRWKSGFRFRRDRMAVLLRWWREMPERLAAVAFRLQGVLIENRDYREILEDFDGPKTLFYFDPPRGHPKPGRMAQGRTRRGQRKREDGHGGAVVQSKRGAATNGIASLTREVRR